MTLVTDGLGIMIVGGENFKNPLFKGARTQNDMASQIIDDNCWDIDTAQHAERHVEGHVNDNVSRA